MTATDNYEFNPNAVGNRVARWFDRRATNERALDAMRVDRDRYRLLTNRIEVERAEYKRERDLAQISHAAVQLALAAANARIEKLEHDLNAADAHAAGMVKRINASTLGFGDKAKIIGSSDHEAVAG